MKVVIIIDDSLKCFEEYQATGNLRQTSVRTKEIEIEDIDLSKGESIHSVHLKLKEQIDESK